MPQPYPDKYSAASQGLLSGIQAGATIGQIINQGERNRIYDKRYSEALDYQKKRDDEARAEKMLEYMYKIKDPAGRMAYFQAIKAKRPNDPMILAIESEMNRKGANGNTYQNLEDALRAGNMPQAMTIKEELGVDDNNFKIMVEDANSYQEKQGLVNANFAKAGITPEEPFNYTPKELTITPTDTARANSVSLGGGTEKGNIDLTKRPVVKNPNGSISTVRSMSVNIDGQEVLIPTVSDDGRILSENDAINLYRKTGKHLGKFNTPEEATAYAEKLHREQEAMYGGGDRAIPYQSGLLGNGQPELLMGEDRRFRPWRADYPQGENKGLEAHTGLLANKFANQLELGSQPETIQSKYSGSLLSTDTPEQKKTRYEILNSPLDILKERLKGKEGAYHYGAQPVIDPKDGKEKYPIFQNGVQVGWVGEKPVDTKEIKSQQKQDFEMAKDKFGLIIKAILPAGAQSSIQLLMQGGTISAAEQGALLDIVKSYLDTHPNMVNDWNSIVEAVKLPSLKYSEGVTVTDKKPPGFNVQGNTATKPKSGAKGLPPLVIK